MVPHVSLQSTVSRDFQTDHGVWLYIHKLHTSLPQVQCHICQIRTSVSNILRHLIWLGHPYVTDLCLNGAEMLFQMDEEGEELKMWRSFILLQLVPIWQANMGKPLLLTALSCKACLPGKEDLLAIHTSLENKYKKSCELKAQHDLLGNLGITLLMSGWQHF